MEPFTLLLLAGGAYLATRKKTPTPTPSGGGDAYKPNDQGTAAEIDLKKESGGNTSAGSERAEAVQKYVNARIAKALKTSNFSQLSLAELNQINPATLRNQAERDRFLLVRKIAAAKEANKNDVVIENGGSNNATKNGGSNKATKSGGPS
jgi:uncharacterized protein (DUF885 family)